jgi:hypothetical protein
MAKSVEELSVSQAAKRSSLEYYQIHRLVKKNYVKARRVGWFWLIDAESLADYLKTRAKKRRKAA